MSHATLSAPPQRGLLPDLFPQLMAVAFTYLVSGASFATIPLFVSRELGQGATVVGTLTGLSFLVAIATRLWAGGFADRKGPKPALILGVWLAVLSGLFAWAADIYQDSTRVAIWSLILSRVLLGSAEAIVVVAAQTWALAVAGPTRSAMALGWVGSASFVTTAIGAPVGGILYAAYGFEGVAIAMILIPVPIIAWLMRVPGASVEVGQSLVFMDVIRRIAIHCVTIGLVGVSYGTIVSFSVLLFEERGWAPPWMGLTLFSVALVAIRVFAGSVPDRFGAGRTAVWSLLVQFSGFALMAHSHSVAGAYVGAMLAGLGFALVYPSVASQALNRVPPRNRGAAMALFSAAVNLVLGIGGPFMGLLAEHRGTGAVFYLAAVAAFLAGLIVLSGRTSAPYRG